jgi:hypothetical protein
MKRWFFRLLIVVVIAGIIGAVMAMADQKRRMAEMSDDELRAYLGRKLEGRVPPEKIEQIQDKVTAAVRSGRSAVDAAPTSSNGGTAAKTESAVAVADDADDAVSDAADDADDAVTDAAADVGEVGDEAN